MCLVNHIAYRVVAWSRPCEAIYHSCHLYGPAVYWLLDETAHVLSATPHRWHSPWCQHILEAWRKKSSNLISSRYRRIRCSTYSCCPRDIAAHNMEGPGQLDSSSSGRDASNQSRLRPESQSIALCSEARYLNDPIDSLWILNATDSCRLYELSHCQASTADQNEHWFVPMPISPIFSDSTFHY